MNHHISTLPVMKRAPKIDIDASKCTVPLDCRKCLEICPQAVLYVESGSFPRLIELDPKQPGAYILSAKFRYACTLCDDCIRVCPTGAITITPVENGAK